MLWAACCIAIFGFLRCGELTCTSASTPVVLAVNTVNDISVNSRVNPSYIQVFLRSSKTDPFGVGVTLALGKTGHVICPVSAVLSYLAVRSSAPGPLFIFPDGSPLSRNKLMSAVRQALVDQGIDAARVSGHSFRIGAATTAAAAGLSDLMIKKLGRWNAYMSYIRLPTDRLVRATAHLVGSRLSPNDS